MPWRNIVCQMKWRSASLTRQRSLAATPRREITCRRQKLASFASECGLTSEAKGNGRPVLVRISVFVSSRLWNTSPRHSISSLLRQQSQATKTKWKLKELQRLIYTLFCFLSSSLSLHNRSKTSKSGMTNDSILTTHRICPTSYWRKV